MRLVCPNCSAQYEIDVSMIPDEGRDVQCSNCGHTWFELPAPPEMADADPTPEIEAAAQPEPEPEPEPETEIEAEAETEVEPEPEPDTEAEVSAEDDEPPESVDEDLSEEVAAIDDAFKPKTEPVADLTTRELEDAEKEVFGSSDPKPKPTATEEALDILRQEAEEEIEKRRAPPSVPIETQTDMGLEGLYSKPTPSRALRARMARLEEEDEAEQQSEKPGRVAGWKNRFGKGGAQPEEEPSDEPEFADEKESDESYSEPRRDLLPDIEEINSTLASTKTRDLPAPEVMAERQRDFRQGFVIPVALAAILIVLYAYAPAIAQRVPATEPALLQYVDVANGARDSISALLGR